MSHHRTPEAGGFWKTPGTTELAVNVTELAVKKPCLLPSLVTMRLPPLAESAQATLQEGTGKSPTPCDGSANILPPSSRLGRASGQCMGPQAFAHEKSSWHAIPCLFYGRPPKGS